MKIFCYCSVCWTSVGGIYRSRYIGVFFGGANAPEELHEFSVIHDGTTLEADLEPGDFVSLDGEEFKILAVGEIANQNFRNLGHLVLKFNGETVVDLPGDVCVEAKPLALLHPGSKIEIFSKDNL